jgi:ABC-type glycerol-3-phosphate transport system substrate-binding protein
VQQTVAIALDGAQQRAAAPLGVERSGDGGEAGLAANSRARNRDWCPAHPAWSTLELTLRTGISEDLQGQKTAKQALDAVAADWRRTFRRAGIERG